MFLSYARAMLPVLLTIPNFIRATRWQKADVDGATNTTSIISPTIRFIVRVVVRNVIPIAVGRIQTAAHVIRWREIVIYLIVIAMQIVVFKHIRQVKTEINAIETALSKNGKGFVLLLNGKL